MTVFVNNICSYGDTAIQVRAYVSLDKTALNALKRLISCCRICRVSADNNISNEHSVSDIVTE